MKKITIRDIAELGIFAGLAIVLHLPIFRISVGPQGGSISFVMIPLFIIALRHSWWKSLITIGIVFAFPACLISGYGIQTYPLDYLLGYGVIAIVSLFRFYIFIENKSSYLFLILSIVLATFARYCVATLSSMVIYEYPFVAALTYNVIYVFVSGAIGLVMMLILLKPLQIINKKYPN